MKLYELGEQFVMLQQMLEQEQDNQTLQDTMEALEGEIECKIESIAKIVKNLEADVDAYKQEEQRMANRRKTLENNIKWLKDMTLAFMRHNDIQKVKGEIFNISIANNGGKLPVIVDVPVDMLPDDYCKVTRVADVEKIADAIDAGNTSFGHYAERGTHLNIR